MCFDVKASVRVERGIHGFNKTLIGLAKLSQSKNFLLKRDLHLSLRETKIETFLPKERLGNFRLHSVLITGPLH